MAKTLAIALAVLAALALLAALLMFCHGCYARWQMNRYQRRTP